jgi:hypothetical protein
MSAGDFPLSLPISGTAARVIYIAALPDDHARRADGSSHLIKIYITQAEAALVRQYITGPTILSATEAVQP